MKRIIMIGIGITIVGLGVVAWGARPLGGTSQTITIAPETSRLVIARDLQEKNIIRSRASFLALLLVRGGVVRAGSYTLDPNRSLWATVAALTKGRNRFITLTIPEGWRREQIAQAITQNGLDGTAFLTLTSDKEGYLFPDTYFLSVNATPQEITDKFSTNFTNRTQNEVPTRDQLILASIVEREAKSDSERPLIAGIYMNRLKIGMALQADPTVQYAKESILLTQGKIVTEFWQPITLDDYRAVVSPYNTYLAPGLPPGPIANPGLKSIEAAMNPATLKGLFFFHAPDGQLIISSTHEEHVQNKKKYF